MSINKIIFQIGLLAFCVSAVIFATGRVQLLEAVSRSFIVFVGVIIISAVSLTVMALVGRKRPEQKKQAEPQGRERSTVPPAASGGERKRSS